MEDPKDPQDLLNLPSLLDFRTTLEALLQTPYPPRSLFIQASSNARLLEDIIAACLPTRNDCLRPPSPAGSDSGHHPTVQDLLPQAVIIDCAEVASTKALFGRVLNGLSGWGRGQWNEDLGGIINWDGRQEGYRVQQDPQTGQWTLQWDYDGALDTIPTSNTKTGITDRKDESLSAFLEGLKMIFTLGGVQNGGSDSDTKPNPRFVVLLNAERLSSLESLPIGQSEGTLLASFMRLGELTGKPIVPLLTSQNEWLLLRPSRGATEPGVTLQLPSLRRQDIIHYLRHIGSRDIPASSNLTIEQQTVLLSSLASVLQQTFEPYLGDELEDYLWLMEKMWPEWRRPVENGSVQAGDVNRLVALLKNTLSREIECLGELRPLLVDERTESDGLTGQENQAVSDSSSANTHHHHTTPRKFPLASSSHANSPYNGSPLAGFSPSANTPSTKRNRNQSDSILLSTSSSATSITNSLSILSRYILIAAFLASSNPSKKDMLMLATQEDDLALSKRRKKGGAMRKTPSKRNMNGNNDNDNANGQTLGPIRKKDTMVPQRMLGPKPFPLERLIAITETILPVEMRKLAKSQDILQEIATLTSLRLLLKTTSSASFASSSTQPTFTSSASSSITTSPFDKLDGIKLRCSAELELEFVENIGKSVGFKVGERLWEMFG